MDEAGDALVTYRDYWEDLTALSAGNLVQADNERTALVLYKELVGQMVSRAAEFRDDGVREAEMQAQLSNIRAHLMSDFGSGRRGLEEEIEQLQEEIEKAEKMIQSAYRQTQWEEADADGTVS